MPSARLGQAAWKLLQSPAVIFAIALTTRLWLAAQLLPEKAWPFFYEYNEPSRIAWAVVSGYGYSSPWPRTPLLPTAQQPPVYPLLVAGIFRILGAYSVSSLWTVVILNAIFSALTAVAILQIGKRTFGTSVGVLAAWVWSWWLYEAAISIRVWESSLSALLLATALLLLPELGGSRRSLWLIFGLLAGVAVLNNTSLLAVFPFFWLWLWINCRRLQSCNKQLLASIGICILTLVPWTIRNYVTFYRLMPIRDNLGLELWIGNHEGEARLNGDDFLRMVAEYNRLGEMRFMDTKRQLAAQFIRQHPGSFLRLSVQRFYKFWTAPDGSAWILVGPLAWLGMFLALWQKGLTAVRYAIVIVMFPFVYYITHTGSMYRHPAEPVILVLAAYASVSTLQALAKRWRKAA